MRKIRKKKISFIRNILGRAILLFVLFFLFLAESSCKWFLATFGEMDFSIVVYQLFSPMEGTSQGILNEYAHACLYPSISSAVLIFLIYVFWDYTTKRLCIDFHLRLFRKKWNLHISHRMGQAIKYVCMGGCVVFLLASLGSKMIKMGVPAYLAEVSQDSTLFEDYYVSPETVHIEFPESKRNLLLIYVESMESTYASTEEGGAKEINYIPELTKLANENLNFSDNEKLGGAHNYAGGWTIAGLLASSSGVPYKLPIEGNSSGEYETFLPGLITLGEILEEEGYTNYFMCGSDATFGGRRAFYDQHGDYVILDYDKAIENEIIPSDYLEYWGMEDEKLYAFAKQQLSEIARNENPFNFSMLTVDTHHPEGYACQLCQNQHGSQFANAISCASRQVYDFVMWCQEQEWYENTTIVITGDHLSMNNTFWDDIGDYERNVYNCFINIPRDLSPVRPKNREFSAIDLFPTILASLDVKIEDDYLGLGVNLFSDKMTLPEMIGKEKFEKELKLFSKYYFSQFVIA